MTIFIDGPAASASLELRRFPVYLRVVVDESGAADALDQLDDTPKDDESITVYRIVGTPTNAFVDGTKNGKRFGYSMKMARYQLCGQPYTDEDVRDNDRWREWTKNAVKFSPVTS